MVYDANCHARANDNNLNLIRILEQSSVPSSKACVGIDGLWLFPDALGTLIELRISSGFSRRTSGFRYNFIGPALCLHHCDRVHFGTRESAIAQ